MERKESRFSPRARRLISRSVVLGVDPSRIHALTDTALELDGRVTRDKLSDLTKEIRSIRERKQNV